MASPMFQTKNRMPPPSDDEMLFPTNELTEITIVGTRTASTPRAFISSRQRLLVHRCVFRRMLCLVPFFALAICAPPLTEITSNSGLVYDPQIEQPADDDGLPAGWSLNVISGTYETAVSQRS